MLKRAIPFLLLAVPTAVHAQSAADARWMAQCRDRDDAWRAKACEVRVTSLAKGGVITVDPGRNGAVAVEGWDRDSIEVHARIQAEGATNRKSTRLNCSHVEISYAVFCLKKKKNYIISMTH